MAGFLDNPVVKQLAGIAGQAALSSWIKNLAKNSKVTEAIAERIVDVEGGLWRATSEADRAHVRRQVQITLETLSSLLVSSARRALGIAPPPRS